MKAGPLQPPLSPRLDQDHWLKMVTSAASGGPPARRADGIRAEVGRVLGEGPNLGLRGKGPDLGSRGIHMYSPTRGNQL